MEEFIPIGIYNLDGDEIGYWIHGDKAYLVIKHIHGYDAKYDYMTPKECDFPKIVNKNDVEKIIASLPESRKIVLFNKEYAAKRVCPGVEVVETESGRAYIVDGWVIVKKNGRWEQVLLSEAKGRSPDEDTINLFGLQFKGKKGNSGHEITHNGVYARIEADRNGIHGVLEFEKSVGNKSITVVIDTKKERIMKEVLELGTEGVQLHLGEGITALLVVGSSKYSGVYDGKRAIFFDEKIDAERVNGVIVARARGITFVVRSAHGLQEALKYKLKRGTFVVENDDGWIYVENGKPVFVKSLDNIVFASKWLRNASKLLPVVALYEGEYGEGTAIVDDGKIRFEATVDMEKGKYYELGSTIRVVDENGMVIDVYSETHEELVGIINDFEKFLGRKIRRVFQESWVKTIYFLENGKTVELNSYGVRVDGKPIAALALKEFI